jgi:hypothetical protein
VGAVLEPCWRNVGIWETNGDWPGRTLFCLHTIFYTDPLRAIVIYHPPDRWAAQEVTLTAEASVEMARGWCLGLAST